MAMPDWLRVEMLRNAAEELRARAKALGPLHGLARVVG